MANQVQLNAGAASGAATDYGIYTWSGDVNPVIGTPATFCSSCHSWSPGTIVGVAATLAPCAGQTRVVAGNAGASILYTKSANAATCGGVMPPSSTGLSAANLKILRAWINNGALNN
jgi:hypothetical protein